jgi:tungstate transport system substrate-binding protein
MLRRRTAMQIGRRIALVLALALLSTLVHGGVYAEKPFIVVQSTTSTRDTGLFDYLLPKFTNKTGIEVRLVAVGTGQALKNA